MDKILKFANGVRREEGGWNMWAGGGVVHSVMFLNLYCKICSLYREKNKFLKTDNGRKGILVATGLAFGPAVKIPTRMPPLTLVCWFDT